MEENNMGSNQTIQENTQNSVTSKNQGNNNKILIIVLVLIIVGLLGYFAYDKFIKKDNSGEVKDSNTQEQGNSNQQTIDNTGNEQNINNGGISKKLISLKGSCNDVSESYNGIRVELKKSPDSERCIYDLKINDKKISADEGLEIESVEFYENYVIVFVSEDGGSSIYLVDTNNSKYDIYDGIEYHHTEDILGCPLGFNPNFYVSDEDGIIIDGTNISGQCGITDPGYNYAKIKVPYANGKFGSPEIIEKINNR